MPARAQMLWKRQGGNYNGDWDGSDDFGDDDFDDGSGVDWWFTPAGYAVRYAIVIILFSALILYFVGGYIHAKRRVRKGLPPLRYHKWMANRTFASRSYPQYQHAQPGPGYQMENYAPPPPAYTSADAPPPVYQPPEGGSKVMADQQYVHAQPVGETSSAGGLAAPPAAQRQ